jgi:hypothetical protein
MFMKKKPVERQKFSKDELVLHLVSTGLVQYTEGRKSLQNPYPDNLQRGLNLLTLLCIERRKRIPQGIPELIMWCRNKAIPDFGLDIESVHDINEDDRLLNRHVFTVTDFCMDWACTGPNVEDELMEEKLLSSALGTCRKESSQKSYESFRRLLIERPVIKEFDLLKLMMDSQELYILEKEIRSSYVSCPTVHSLKGYFYCCSRCGSLLLKRNDGKLICEHDYCRATGYEPGKKIPENERIVSLKRGLRRYITLPGLAELRLEKKLKKLNLDVEMWPDFDSFDLRIEFPDKEVWAVDVKDWTNPFYLAHRVKPFPNPSSWTKARFIFPDERKRQRSDYLRAFCKSCKILDNKTRAAFETQFIKAVKDKLQELQNA